jgi:cation:H+ antiporter
MVLLAGVGFAVAVTDFVVPLIGAGVGTLILAAACVQALRIANRFERANVWRLVDPAPAEKATRPALSSSLPPASPSS